MERWHEFAPDESDVPDGWWRTVRGIHSATMPAAKHRRIAVAFRQRLGSSAWIQADSPFWEDPLVPEDEHDLFAAVDALLPSEADVESYRPDAARDQTVLTLLDHGAKTIVLKLGSAGCRIFEQGRGMTAEIPVVAVKADHTEDWESTAVYRRSQLRKEVFGDARPASTLVGVHLT